MIIDVTGVVLNPGADGEECLGNGKHRDAEGNLIECCCDECDYYLECFSDWRDQSKQIDKRLFVGQ